MNNEFEGQLMFPNDPYVMLTRDMRLRELVKRVMLSPCSVEHALHHHKEKEEEENGDLWNRKLLKI